MSFNGFVKIHRKLLEWEWADSPKHIALFAHLLLRANYKTTRWRGQEIKAGQLLTGRKQLSIWTGLSQQSVRTVLIDLKSTSEVTIKTTSKYSIISITNWDTYQLSNQQANQQVTSKQPASNHIQEGKEGKEEKKKATRIANKVGVSPSVVMELFNTLSDSKLSKIKSLSTKRIKLINSMSIFLKTEKDWGEYVAQVLVSPFLLGDNDRGWRADFDWMLNQNNYLKVIEGKYESKRPENKRLDTFNQLIDAVGV